jgi:excisionase family DNA binding protein
MRDAPTQLQTPKNPDSSRRTGLRLPTVNARRESDRKVFAPRLRILECPNDDMELTVQSKEPHVTLPEESGVDRTYGKTSGGVGAQRKRARGNWSVSPLWEGKILLGVLREQGLAGNGLVRAFEKWAPRVAGCSRDEMNRVYREQTGREMSDYILVQQADKVVRYRQLPPEADVVRRTVLGSDSFSVNVALQLKQPENPWERKGSLRWSKQRLIDEHDSNVLLSTNELASLTGFRPKTIRRWVSRKLLNYIRVGNRLRFRLAAVELFLAQREVRK